MYSYDIFDTIMTRKTATPKGIFSIVQFKLQHELTYQKIDSHVRYNFYSLRVKAEEAAREMAAYRGEEEITLDSIYDNIKMCGNLSSQQVRLMKQLEVDTELDNVLGIACNVKEIEKLMNTKEKVVLISDMYLPEKVIREMLCKISPVFRDVAIYVSSAYGKTKASGGLYDIVREQEKMKEDTTWIHIGEHKISDVQIPKSKGIDARRYAYEPLTQCEQNMLTADESNISAQILVGNSINARLNADAKWNTNAYKMGTSIGGPVLCIYVNWVLEKSMQSGVERLYFVARDGYVLKRIADQIICEKQYKIKTSYFYGSRKAWRIPALSRNKSFLQYIINHSYFSKVHDVDQLADFLEIPVEVIKKYIVLEEELYHKKITKELMAELVRILFADERFYEEFAQIHKEKRENITGYIRQEIGEEENFAFVELSGTGITQECLAEFCTEIFQKPIQTFYAKKDPPNVEKKSISYVFFYNSLPQNYIIEELCRAPHGQTIGYERTEKGYSPVLGLDEFEGLKKIGYDDYLEGIHSYVEQFVHNRMTEEVVDAVGLFEKYIYYITRTPDEAIGDFIGDMQFELTGRDTDIKTFAPRLTREQIRDYYLLGRKKEVLSNYKGHEWEYSVLRCSKAEKELIEKYKIENAAKETGHAKKGIRDKKEDYLIPVDLLKKNVILYGAGKRGKRIHDEISSNRKSNIIAWVDKQYSLYKELNVSNPQVIKSVCYDQVVVTVGNPILKKEIEWELTQLGVEQKKMFFI